MMLFSGRYAGRLQQSPERFFINDFDGLTVSSTHGSPWRYDTFVPVIFAGNGLPAARVVRAVTPYDIAPTLSAYLGVKPPSGTVGAVLPEVLDDQAYHLLRPVTR